MSLILVLKAFIRRQNNRLKNKHPGAVLLVTFLCMNLIRPEKVILATLTHMCLILNNLLSQGILSFLLLLMLVS